MILLHPATLATLLWLLLTGVILVVLGRWSAGVSWGISSAVVRGDSGWARRDAAAGHEVSPQAVELPVLPPAGAPQPPRLPHRDAGAAARWRESDPETEDLDIRSIG